MGNKSMLHELLAVEGDLEGAHKKILAETIKTFGKAEHFLGIHKKVVMFVDDGIEHPEGNKAIDTTVQEKLDYMQKTEVRYFNALLQKEATNQTAKADLVVDGKVICSDLPATFLLGMETRLKHLRGAYEAIPTLSPGTVWEHDTKKGLGIFRAAHVDEKFKTETKVEPVVLYEATKEHPAQVKEMSITKNVGKHVSTHWSSMISPAEKSEKLGRIDKLIRAVKKARQKANTAEVVKRTVGAQLFDFING